MRGGVIELSTIVTLDGLDGEAELCGHPSIMREIMREIIDLKGGKSTRLGT